MSKISSTPAIVLNITGFFSGQRPDESHCNCVSEQLATNHIVDVGCLAAHVQDAEEDCKAVRLQSGKYMCTHSYLGGRPGCCYGGELHRVLGWWLCPERVLLQGGLLPFADIMKHTLICRGYFRFIGTVAPASSRTGTSLVRRAQLSALQASRAAVDTVLCKTARASRLVWPRASKTCSTLGL